MAPTIEVLEDAFNQDDGVFNQEDDVTVGDFDVIGPIVKGEVDINIDGLNSNEDELHVKDEVPIIESKITGLEDEVPME